MVAEQTRTAEEPASDENAVDEQPGASSPELSGRRRPRPRLEKVLLVDVQVPLVVEETAKVGADQQKQTALDEKLGGCDERTERTTCL